MFLVQVVVLGNTVFEAWRSAAFRFIGFKNFTRQGFQERSKNFRQEDMQARMEGKNCIVTGANSGIGYAAAEGLASCGATVYMVCRNKEKGEAALSQIQSSTGNPNVFLEVCDLSSMSEIKSFASRFSSMDQPLHLLVNNAGLMEREYVTTSEGLELSCAVNVAGTYALTELMLPLLKKAAPDARVIMVSSSMMYMTPLSMDLQVSETDFDGTREYVRSKRVQVALTDKWAEIHDGDGIGFYSMHPGWADTPGVAKCLPDFYQRFSDRLRTREEGADTIVWLALQPKEKLVPGAFYCDRAVAPKHWPLLGTAGSDADIASILDALRSLCNQLLPP